MSESNLDQAAAGQIAEAARLGVAIPEVLLPHNRIDLFRWAVVACDQYTSQPEYWQETESIVGESPSTLRLTLPEIYLENPGHLPVEDRIIKINHTMCRYLDDGTLSSIGKCWIAVDRATAHHESRKSLLLAIDLECYDFEPGNRKLIRATEGTVLDRIPPRLAIRREAPLELPHVQLLIDDPRQTVIEPLLFALSESAPDYDTPLMQNGGRVRGWKIPAGSSLIEQALSALAGLDSLLQHGLLFAVGDGNHSLATAKAHWEQLRGRVPADHPARYALAEVINIHDKGLCFEPIHRVVFDLDPDLFLTEARLFFAQEELTIAEDSHPGTSAPNCQVLPLFLRDKRRTLQIARPARNLTAGSVQSFLDSLAGRTGCRIDYIHGEDVVRQLAGQGHLGLLLPALDKSCFFGAIARDGILPRKTFSMGEANEKRYYIECRRIV